MKITKIMLCILGGLFLWTALSEAKINRQYEPIIITGEKIIPDTLFSPPLYDVNYLYLFAYHQDSDSWEIIPFQIDEADTNYDEEDKYFKPEKDSLLRGVFDFDDELVFISADVGDRADSTSWAAGVDSTTRYEIEITDTLNQEQGYVYLYYADQKTYEIPNFYEMTFDSTNDRVSSINYELGFIEKSGKDSNKTGQLNDVIIKSGSGEDLFDRLKIRAFGSFWFLPIILYEEQVTASQAYAKQGPVRIIKNMDGRFVYEGLGFDEKFTQTSYFYPWHGSFQLIDIPIGEAKDVGAEVDEIRVSWDFNSKAKGMKFFTEYNKEGVLIDGIKDNVDLTCSPGELNWTMGTGDQGTLLNVFHIPPLGNMIRLYYHESTKKTVADQSKLSVDTGDDSSFADNGFSLIDDIENYITDKTTFSAIYYNLFLPPNFDPDSASLICEQLKAPLHYLAKSQNYIPPTKVAIDRNELPSGFWLAQNYPNPFNASTTISFSLSKNDHITLRIYDSLGRLISTLVNQQLREGFHRYVWHGRDDEGFTMPSGIYFYKLSSAKLSTTRKLILIK